MAVWVLALLTLVFEPAQQQQQNPPPKPPPQTTPAPEKQAPVHLFLSGRVIMADGSSVPTDTQIFLLCDGSIRRQTHIIGDGDFSFSLGSGGAPDTGFMDASVSGSENDMFGSGGGTRTADPTLTSRMQTSASMRRVNLHGCSIQAQAAGYQSTVLHLGTRSALDRPHVGDLFLQPIVRPEAGTISATRLAAPKDAIKAFEKALREFEKEKFKKAASEAGKAVKEYPEFAEAWQLMGASHHALGDSEKAVEAFERARNADPDYLPPLVALSRVHVKAGRFAEAAEMSGEVIGTAPSLYDAFYIHSLSHYNLGNLDTALESVQQYFERASVVSPTAHLLMGFVLAERREFQEAAAAFEQYLSEVPQGDASDHARQQLNQWRESGLIVAKPSGERRQK